MDKTSSISMTLSHLQGTSSFLWTPVHTSPSTATAIHLYSAHASRQAP